MDNEKHPLILDELSSVGEPSTDEFWLYQKTSLPFSAYNNIFKTELDTLASQFSVPISLNEADQLAANALLKSLTDSFKGLYGDNIPTSYEVGSNGATLVIDSHIIHDYDDYCDALSKLSGYLSAEHILDELLMSFEPLSDQDGNYNKSKMLARLKNNDLALVIQDNMPSERVVNKVNTTIEVKKIPLQLRQAISKSTVIYSFIEDCLSSIQTKIDLMLTITKLTLLTVIKRDGVDYEIEGINDIHLVILGLSSISELEAIGEADLVLMYRKLGVTYIPSNYEE